MMVPIDELKRLPGVDGEEAPRMPTTRSRVPEHTSSRINWQIQRDIERRLRHYGHHPDEIPCRLREPDEEWDIERPIEANASALAFAGVVLGVTADRRWLALPVLVTPFSFSMPSRDGARRSVLRRLGFRTSYEIEQERTALKALRGDFGQIAQGPNRIDAVLKAALA